MASLAITKPAKQARLANNLPNLPLAVVTFVGQKLSKNKETGYWGRFLHPEGGNIILVSNNELAAIHIAGEAVIFKAAPEEASMTEIVDDLKMGIQDGVVYFA